MIKYRVWDNRQKTYQSNSGANGYQGNNIWFIKVEDYEKLEQFTGLTDNNGVDIYLGDIVYYERDEENFEIGYDDTIGAISICNGDVCYTFDNLYGKDLEIIGNINENKELLE